MYAILAGHVPPISPEHNLYYKPTCLSHFTTIVAEFGDIILGSYFGHINTDSVVFVTAKRPYSWNFGSQPTPYSLVPATPASLKKNLNLKTDYLISVLYTSTSVVPVSLPSFRLGTVNVNPLPLPPTGVVSYLGSIIRQILKPIRDFFSLPKANQPRVYLSDYSQYAADIVRANRRHKVTSKSAVVYKKLYGAKETLGLAAITLDDWTLWIERTQSSKSGEGFHLPWKKPRKHIYDNKDLIDADDPEDDLEKLEPDQIGETNVNDNHYTDIGQSHSIVYTSPNNKSFPAPSPVVKPNKNLRIPHSVVMTILVLVTIGFIMGITSFLLYIRRLDLSGDVLERQRLFFANVPDYTQVVRAGPGTRV